MKKFRLFLPKRHHYPPHIRKEIERFGIDQQSAETLILQDALAGLDYVPTVLGIGRQAGEAAATFAANFLLHRDIKHRQTASDTTGLPSVKQFIDVYKMFTSKELHSNGADELLFELKKDDRADARKVAEQQGLLQENDEAALLIIVQDVLEQNSKAAEDVKNGGMKAIGFLVGQVMKASKGKANPGVASELIRRVLGV